MAKAYWGGPPPGFPPKETLVMSPVADLEPLGCHSRVVSVDTTVRPFKLECPLFYGVDFQGWRSKLEQFFEAE